ncbi:MAG: Adenosylcobinamide kinase / Adenosylcobinamide-phosphate guanylyltransferase, partial [uncultured Propionibacteriaceae bacterium]
DRWRTVGQVPLCGVGAGDRGCGQLCGARTSARPDRRPGMGGTDPHSPGQTSPALDNRGDPRPASGAQAARRCSSGRLSRHLADRCSRPAGHLGRTARGLAGPVPATAGRFGAGVDRGARTGGGGHERGRLGARLPVPVRQDLRRPAGPDEPGDRGRQRRGDPGRGGPGVEDL